MAKVKTDTEHLFDGEMQFQPEQAATDPTAGRVGNYMGSGTGKARGPIIVGDIKWDLFEKSDENICETNFKGVITTEDKAEIKFDIMGLYLAPEESSHIWKLSAGVKFSTTDEKYEWINRVLGTWEGVMDETKMQARFKVSSRG